MSNADVKKRSKKIQAEQIKESQGFTTRGDTKRYANRDLARMNRASGEAARNSRKRTRY